MPYLLRFWKWLGEKDSNLRNGSQSPIADFYKLLILLINLISKIWIVAILWRRGYFYLI